MENESLWKRLYGWLGPRAPVAPSGVALVEAARRGDARAVRAQLAAGVHPDEARSVNRQTPLYLAADLGHAEVAEALLAAGADPIFDDACATPLLRAAFRGHHGIIDLMAAARPEAFRTKAAALALRRAALSGHALAVRALLNGGAPVKGSERDFPSAMFAAATCDAACLAELLDAGADPNQMDRQGRTPLHYAVIGNDVECVYLLVAAGADPLVEDDYGYTTIDMAASTYLHDYLTSLPPVPCPGDESFGPRSTATI